MSTRIGLFYASWLRNRVHCTCNTRAPNMKVVTHTNTKRLSCFLIRKFIYVCDIYSSRTKREKYTEIYVSCVTQLPSWLIIFSRLVDLRVFQLAIKLAEIFERECKSNWIIQAGTLTTNTGRLDVNKMNSCLVIGLFAEMKTVNSEM